MNPSPVLSLGFVITLLCLPQANAMDGMDAPPHSHRVIHHVRHRASAAHQAAAAGTAAQNAPVIARPAIQPLVRDDSDGLSRDPEDCNMGCLDSAP